MIISIENLYNTYLDLLEEENKRQNLIRYETRDELVQKHLEDTLIPFEKGLIKPLTDRIIDIGSGGGFPSIPLAIMYNTASFTLIESEKRKAQFLNKVIHSLDFKNMIVFNERVEDFAKGNRMEYDYCTMRAVAATGICLEYAAPLLKVGGKVVLYKGPSFKDELEAARNSMKVLGMDFEKGINYDYSYKGEVFNPILAIFQKVEETPKKYPRRPGMAKKHPL
ncbi:MAG: 16S rRNA (guanine(527)-N(7))-methyltransferase RsmG [Thermotogota bacterium]|nr:16S rRNA (guanine(527)-N(7))-methyltransferase RsmG [Thermotogota bacterium]